MKTKQEHSAGGVVYKRFPISHKPSAICYLLGQHSGYHKWVLPKGLIEPGETAPGAALREVKEETGIRAKIIGVKPIHTDTYSYTATFKKTQSSSINHQPSPQRRVTQYQETAPGDTLVHKTVDFYLMEYVSGDPQNHSWEMSDADWFTFDQAVEKLAFPGEKLALQKAKKKIGS